MLTTFQSPVPKDDMPSALERILVSLLTLRLDGSCFALVPRGIREWGNKWKQFYWNYIPIKKRLLQISKVFPRFRSLSISFSFISSIIQPSWSTQSYDLSNFVNFRNTPPRQSVSMSVRSFVHQRQTVRSNQALVKVWTDCLLTRVVASGTCKHV